VEIWIKVVGLCLKDCRQWRAVRIVVRLMNVPVQASECAGSVITKYATAASPLSEVPLTMSCDVLVSAGPTESIGACPQDHAKLRLSRRKVRKAR
jgi:hypothetical protein